MTDITSHLIPLVVSVAGHRDIVPEHEDSIGAHLVHRLKELAKKYKHTPFRCLTGLSEGADMVFAETALELKSQMGSDFSLELVAVLPTASGEFEKFFHHPAHHKRATDDLLKRYRRLLGKCSETIIVQHSPLSDALQAHKLAGEYMARHSHLLLAVWDGKADDAHSCADYVVGLFRDNTPERNAPRKLSFLDATEPRPVHHLLVERDEATQAGEFQWQPAKNQEDKDYSYRMLKALDGFNSAVTERASSDPALLASTGGINLKAEDLTATEHRIWRIYAAADFLALFYQRRARTALRMIFAAAWLMVLLFASYAHLINNPIVLGAYVLVFVLGVVIFALSNKSNIYVQYLDYRGLAEGLRVQLFYCLSGIDTNVADYYMRKHKSELAWIRSAIRTLYYGEDRRKLRLDLVEEHWIKDQSEYFLRKSPENEKQYKRHEHIAQAVFILGILIAVAVCVIEAFVWRESIGHEHKSFIIILMEMLPATAAALTGYAYRMGLDQQIKQYAHMGELFGRAQKAVVSQNISTERDFQTLVEELGKEALAENGDWVLLHRDRPIPWTTA